MTLRERHEIATPDGSAEAWLCRPSGAGPWPGVLFFMDGLGVRPVLVDMAARLASHGYVVLLPDLFYRAGPRAPLDPAVVLADPARMRELVDLVATLDGATVMRDAAAYLDRLESFAFTSGGASGCVGYCMGGGFALLAAGTYPERIGAAACIHGASLATDRPASPHARAAQIRGKLYVGVAETDPWLADGEMRRLESALTHARVDYRMETYAGTQHGFAVGDLPVYDRAASERHWQRLSDLFRGSLSVA
jgi:carboxymethylenebutenolidase